MVNSCIKGKRGERDFRDKLREHGFSQAKRGQQHAGGADSPDVICPEMPSIHFEVKYTEKFGSGDMYNAIAQSKRDAGDYKLPTVAFRRNRDDWLVIMDANDWLNMVKQTKHVKSIFCPDCGSSDHVLDGKDLKSKQRYRCKNEACERETFLVEQ